MISLRPLLRSLAAVAAASVLGAAAPDDPYAPFVEPGFPFIVSTVDAGKLGAAFPERNLAVRCVVLMLGNDVRALVAGAGAGVIDPAGDGERTAGV